MRCRLDNYILSGDPRNSHWVKNIMKDPRVKVRVGNETFEATARVLDRQRDRDAWDTGRRVFKAKYGWGGGLPVEITPA